MSNNTHPQKLLHGAGFTRIELLVVVVILTFISVGIMTGYSRFLDQQSINEAAEGTISIIQKARELTLASTGATYYGIHVDTGNKKIQLFKTSPTPSTNIIDTINISGRITISTFQGFWKKGTPCTQSASDVDLYFQRLTGDMYLANSFASAFAVCQTGSDITFRLSKSPASTPERKVVVFPIGTIQLQ